MSRWPHGSRGALGTAPGDQEEKKEPSNSSTKKGNLETPPPQKNTGTPGRTDGRTRDRTDVLRVVRGTWIHKIGTVTVILRSFGVLYRRAAGVLLLLYLGEWLT